MARPQILIVDDDASIRHVLSEFFTRKDYDVRATATAASAWSVIESGGSDVVICDVILPDEDGFSLFRRTKERFPALPVITISAHNNFMTAMQASQLGAFDYLPKPFDLDTLALVVARALASTEPAKSAGSLGEPMPIIGRSEPMQQVFRAIAKLAKTDLSVIVRGESGTGKELVARALHDFSKRKDGPFVPVNMAAIPRELIESELFGFEKGAFTGADTTRRGHFEQAHEGTLFLDEIGDMPHEAQTRLLRVLQQGEITRVGGREPIRTDVRIVAATNKNLEQLMGAHHFREDLYYRLNVVPIMLPPLRERGDDIIELAENFLGEAGAEGLQVKTLLKSAHEPLVRYPWPGNVRELKNFMMRLSAILPQSEIDGDTARLELKSLANGALNSASMPTPGANNEPVDKFEEIAGFLGRYLAEHFSQNLEQEMAGDLHERMVRTMEKPLFAHVLHQCGGNQLKAARVLGINRNTLYKKLRACGISAGKATREDNG